MPDETCRAFDSVAPFDARAAPVRGRGRRGAAAHDPGRAEGARRPVRIAAARAREVPAQRRGAGREDQGERARRDDPLKTLRTFVVGEGSQLAAANAGLDPTLRFVVTLGRGPDGPDVFLSTLDPEQPGSIELMAWDRGPAGSTSTGRRAPSAMWMFAGNSTDALRKASRGKGPFESHPSGALLMKELKRRGSTGTRRTRTSPDRVREDDPRRKHPWFTKKDPLRRVDVEDGRRAAGDHALGERVRFRRLRKRAAASTRPRQIMAADPRDADRQPDHQPHREPRGSCATSSFDLPQTFFVDSEALADVLGLAAAAAVQRHAARSTRSAWRSSTSGSRTARASCSKGDTHFCFLVPERAFEDLVVLREAIEIGLLTERLAACLLMVDSRNPVFSGRRGALLRHVPATATIANGKSSFSHGHGARDPRRGGDRRGVGARSASSPSAGRRARDSDGAFNTLLKPLLRRRRGAAEDAGGIRRLLPAGRGAPARVRGDDADRASSRCCFRRRTSTRAGEGCDATAPSRRADPCPSSPRFSTPRRPRRRARGRLEQARQRGCFAPYLAAAFRSSTTRPPRNTPAGAPAADGRVDRVSREPAPARPRSWGAGSGRTRASRDAQDEYCEWSVTRELGRQDHARHVHERGPGVLGAPRRDRRPISVLELYRKLVDPTVKPRDLLRPGGQLQAARTAGTRRRRGRLAHLIQRQQQPRRARRRWSREATVLRAAERRAGHEPAGARATARALGNPLRNSDPQIAAAVNVAAARATRSRSSTRSASTSRGS